MPTHEDLVMAEPQGGHQMTEQKKLDRPELRKKIAEGFISDDAMNGLSWLTEYNRTPTWLELDRFIRALGYSKVALIPDIDELKEELRVGNQLTATLTDKCRELELRVEEAKKEGYEAISRTNMNEIEEAKKQEREKIAREGLAKINLTSKSKKLAIIETYLEAIKGKK